MALTAAVALAGAGRPYAVVCGLLLLATAAVAARHGRRVDDRDIGALAACVHAASPGEARLTRLPCGALVSAGGPAPSATSRFSSGARSPLPPRRARRLASLVAHLAGASGGTEIRPGHGGTVHVIVGPAAQRPRPAGGRLAHSGLPVAAAAGRADAHHVARGERAARLRRAAPRRRRRFSPGRARLAALAARPARAAGGRSAARASPARAPASTRSMPSPPRWRPAPPEPSTSS